MEFGEYDAGRRGDAQFTAVFQSVFDDFEGGQRVASLIGADDIAPVRRKLDVAGPVAAAGYFAQQREHAVVADVRSRL